jgi:hypothetical protein
MTYPTGNDTRLDNPVQGGVGWDTQQFAAIVVFGSMLFLFLVRRGFRGLNVGGINVSLK